MNSLIADGAGGIWIGTGSWLGEGGLAHYDGYGAWEVFNEDNSGLPDNWVSTLISDGGGGIWIGTGTWYSAGEGLTHYNGYGTWEVFNEDNSGLPDNWVQSLLSDGAGGLWIGGGGGLIHMTFSSKEKIAQAITNESQKEEILYGERAAILIHPRGMGHNEKTSGAIAIKNIATDVYNTLLARGYDNSEIYFLSHTYDIDINGDGWMDKNVVDGPVGLEEIKKAFSWAKKQGRLDQPLLFIFVDHGGEDSLIISPENKTIDAQTLKRLFDDYQSVTGNTIIAILEACYSGSLVDDLSGKNRIIITSAGNDTKAYYDNDGYLSFSKIFFGYLKMGIDFKEAFTLSKKKLPTLGFPFTEQGPLFDDDGDPNTSRDGSFASKYCLNGCFGDLAGEVSIEPIGLAATQDVKRGEKVELRVRVSSITTESTIRKVRAVIRTPESYHSIDEFGFPVVPPAVKSLTKGDDGIWSGSFSDFDYNGKYYLTFTAEDNDGFVSQSKDTITFVLNDGKGLDVSQMEEAVESSETPENGHDITPEADIETAYPIINAVEYHYGDILTVKIPDAPDGIAQYVAIGLPDGSVYIFTGENMATPFKGNQLLIWQGGDTIVNISLGPPLGPPLPAGKYTVYLLRIQAGLDPIMNLDAWRLGVREFKIIK